MRGLTVLEYAVLCKKPGEETTDPVEIDTVEAMVLRGLLTKRKHPDCGCGSIERGCIEISKTALGLRARDLWPANRIG